MTDKVLKYDTNGENLQASSSLNVNSISINSVPVTSSYKASIRANVDPTSNTGPFNGLLIPANGANPQLNMPLRLTNVPVLKLANPYQDDPGGVFTLGSDYIQINQTGTFCVSLNLIVLATNRNFRMSFWVIENGDTIFVNAPIVNGAIRNGNAISNLFYTYGYTQSAAGEFRVTSAPKQIVLAIFIDNNSNVEIIRSSCLCISQI